MSGRTRADVVRKLDDLRREAAGGFATGETTGAFLDRWTVAVKPRLRASTWREYDRHVRTYWAPLHRTPLTQLTPAHVERAMAGLLERGLSEQTVRHARSTLRRALHDAQRDGLLNRNVAALAGPPRVARREMRALSSPEVARLLGGTSDRLTFAPGLHEAAAMKKALAGLTREVREDGVVGGELVVALALVVLGRHVPVRAY